MIMHSIIQILVFIIMNTADVYSYKCGHDMLFKDMKLQSSNLTSTKNRRLSDPAEGIKIHYDFTYITSQQSLEPSISDTSLQNIKTELVATADILKKFIKVISRPATNLYFTESQIKQCDSQLTASPELLSSSDGVDADIVIFPLFYDLDKTVQAAASACITSSVDSRPIVGIVKINKILDFDKRNYEYFFRMLLIHELTHVLVFSQGLITRFINKDPQTGKSTTKIFEKKDNDGVKRFFLYSPKVIEKAKKHFKCNNIDGIQLEELGGEGSAGNHWEARHMLGDYMISTDYPEVVVSDITLALFEDSGWYSVNYYTGGLFRFGKGAGCDFLNNKCMNCMPNQKTDFNNEFCYNPGAPKCTSSRTNRGTCFIGSFKNGIPTAYQYFDDRTYGGFSAANYCPISFDDAQITDEEYYYPSSCKYGRTLYPQHNETIGSNSVCFISTLFDVTTEEKVKSICHEIVCDYAHNTYKINIGEFVGECPSEGGKIAVKGLMGNIICPRFSAVCSGSDFCNNVEQCAGNQITTREEFSVYDSQTVKEDKFINEKYGRRLEEVSLKSCVKYKEYNKFGRYLKNNFSGFWVRIVLVLLL